MKTEPTSRFRYNITVTVMHKKQEKAKNKTLKCV